MAKAFELQVIDLVHIDYKGKHSLHQILITPIHTLAAGYEPFDYCNNP